MLGLPQKLFSQLAIHTPHLTSNNYNPFEGCQGKVANALQVENMRSLDQYCALNGIVFSWSPGWLLMSNIP
jgi:hypothetical protein